VKSLKISTDEVRKVALLSRLSFEAEELEEMKSSMNSILTYMDELNQYDTTDTEPTVHAVEQYNVMRDDVPHESFTNEEALMNAPEKEDGYFKVPKII
jgi:aspartyl-tRNA(Asn)/glutamyl-tRNA(Gln) amidotransferase subunit C